MQGQQSSRRGRARLGTDGGGLGMVAATGGVGDGGDGGGWRANHWTARQHDWCGAKRRGSELHKTAVLGRRLRHELSSPSQ